MSQIRAALFNICFYGYIVLVCLVYLPVLILPRRVMVYAMLRFTQGLHLIEKYILGLDFVVTGQENLPQDGAYIIAMKHQSAYETLKLHILFGDPAIILKRELLWLPLWGWYTQKLQMIAIDRSSGGRAIASIVQGAKRAVAAGRTIVIFPQGTRVAPHVGTDAKPYKIGTYRLYEALGVPVVPVAMNSGQFWGKNAVIKKGGLVTFQFLPAIPAGLSQLEFMQSLEYSIETASNILMKKTEEGNDAAVPNLCTHV